MKRDEDLTMLRECYRMGHGIDFCWGRAMVIEQCDDIPRKALEKLCRIGGHCITEVLAGEDYQKSVFRAAAMLVSRGTANTRTERELVDDVDRVDLVDRRGGLAGRARLPVCGANNEANGANGANEPNAHYAGRRTA